MSAHRPEQKSPFRDCDTVTDLVPAQGDDAGLELFILIDDASNTSRGSQLKDILDSIQFTGEIVVRLKSGDPLIFGRAGEELDVLRRAGIEVEILPGVTAVLAAAAKVQASL